MNIEEERDLDDPCFECLLEYNCTNLCKKGVEYHKKNLEIRTGKWAWSDQHMCEVWQEEEIPEVDFGILEKFNPDNQPPIKFNYWKIIIPILVPITIMVIMNI